MSWGIALIGTPEKVIAELERFGSTLSDTSKLEFDAALPHMKALIGLNFQDNSSALVKFNANGHGMARDGKLVSNQMQMTLDRSYDKLCV